ncbi:hypothetical protein ACI0FS_16900 [Ochrobactrum quorumnocens]|uniref:hypothetical protein n=1 Tax=Ochrobactrum quorumnocens TaxID=271865 RepID=UPI000B052D94|nr:hypothetical protein [[Ochrobactrum] quorumnocens]
MLAVAGVETRIVLGQRNRLGQGPGGRSKWRLHQIVPTLRYFFAKAGAIVSVSKGVAKDVFETLRIPDDRLHALYDAVFNQTFVEQSFEAVEHSWFSNSDIPVILADGNLKPQKDYGTLLKASTKVRVHKEVCFSYIEPRANACGSQITRTRTQYC